MLSWRGPLLRKGSDFHNENPIMESFRDAHAEEEVEGVVAVVVELWSSSGMRISLTLWLKLPRHCSRSAHNVRRKCDERAHFFFDLDQQQVCDASVLFVVQAKNIGKHVQGLQFNAKYPRPTATKIFSYKRTKQVTGASNVREWPDYGLAFDLHQCALSSLSHTCRQIQRG